MSNEERTAQWLKDSRALSPGYLLRHNREEILYIAGEQLRALSSVFSRQAQKRRGVRPMGYIGWLGHRNLGDEVMYHVISQRLAKFEVCQFMPHYERRLAAAGLGGSGFHRQVLLGGGTLLNPLFLQAAELVRYFGLRLQVWGTGVGCPGFGLSESPPLDGWRELLEGQRVTVRGPRSQRALQEIGIQASIFGDPALGLAQTSKPTFRSRRRLIINLAQERGVPYSEPEAAAIEEVGRVAREFVEAGGDVIGVALGNGDRAALERFRLQSRLTAMPIEDHRTDGDRFLRAVTGSTGLIGVRLHSAVLACCVGVPPLLLSYRDKCADFMESMELEEFAVPFTQEQAAGVIRDKWKQIAGTPELGPSIHGRALDWRARQDVQYRELIRELENV